MLSPNAKTVQIGRICQLNYGWGGLLEYSTISGSQQVPFSASTLPLRIGQEVGFYLQCEGNRIEAVNLQAPSSPPSSRSNEANTPETKNRFQIAEASNGDVLSPTSASPILQRQIQRLQQRIAIFGNASQEEQCQMVLEAERALDILLDETDLDGDALCSLVRHCASWLRAPSFSAATKKPLDEETTAASQEIPGHFNLQQRVRKLLIRALSHLDLSDGPTFQALEAAFIYMQTLLQLLDWKARSHLSTKSTSQWLRLRALLSSSLKPMVGEPDQSQQSLPPSYLSLGPKLLWRREDYHKRHKDHVGKFRNQIAWLDDVHTKCCFTFHGAQLIFPGVGGVFSARPVANGPVVEARGDRSVRSGQTDPPPTWTVPFFGER